MDKEQENDKKQEGEPLEGKFRNQASGIKVKLLDGCWI